MLAGWEGQYCQIPHRQSVGQSGTMLPKPSVLLIVLNLEHHIMNVGRKYTSIFKRGFCHNILYYISLGLSLSWRMSYTTQKTKFLDK